MIQIPADLAKLYTSFMEQKGVETDQHRYYIKRKQAHHAVSLFYEMGHLSGRKTRNGTSYGKSAAYGRTEPEISSSHTKKVAFNQVFDRINRINRINENQVNLVHPVREVLPKAAKFRVQNSLVMPVPDRSPG